MKTLPRIALFLVLASSSLTLAQESDSGTGMRRSGYLLDASDQERSTRLSVHAILPYTYFGLTGFPLGVGASFYIPLVKNGFIPPLNDEFGIDFGADTVFFLGYSNVFALWLPVSVLWTFHITDSFSAYAKAGIALRFWPGYSAVFWPDLVANVGVNWMFSKSMGLRAELGYPGAKVGLLIEF